MKKIVEKLNEKEWITYIFIVIIFAMSFLSYNFEVLILPFYFVLIISFIIGFNIFNFEKSFLICLSVYLFDGILNNDMQLIPLSSIMSSLFCIIFFVKHDYFLFKNKKKLSPVIIVIITLLLILYSFIVGFEFKLANIKKFLNVTFLFINIYLFFYHSEEIDIKKISITFLTIFNIVLFLSFALKYTGSYMDLLFLAERFQGLCPNPNSLQIFCVISISIMIILYYRKLISSSEFLLLIIYPLIAGLFTMSKSFLLCLVLLVIISILLMFKRNVKFGILYIVLVCFVCGLLLMFFWDKVLDIAQRFLQSGYSNVLDKLLTGRYSIWTKYIEKWSSSIINILFGCGITTADIVSIGTHNTLINILYRYGLFGVVLLLTLVICYIYYIPSKKVRFRLSGIIPILFFILISFEENLFDIKWGFLFLFILMFIFGQQQGKQVQISEKSERKDINNSSDI